MFSRWTYGERVSSFGGAEPRRSRLFAALVLVCVQAKAQTVPTAQVPLGLDISLPAAKRLAGAREFIAAGEWDAAIKSLDLLAQDFGESLIEVEPARFLSVREAVTATLARLPHPGLAVYRRRIDPAMKSLFAEAEARHSRELMQQIVRDGFASSYGDDALDWLAEEALESGDTDIARRSWSQLISVPTGTDAAFVLRHPDAQLTSAEVCARLVLCSIVEGDQARATGELAAFRERFGDIDGQLAGQTGPLGELLAALLDESREWPARETSNGSGAGNTGPLDLSTIRWSHALAATDQNVVPAVWKDVVILPGVAAVRALSLADGGPRWPSGTADDDGTIYAESLPADDSQPTGGSIPRTGCQIVNGRCYFRIGASSVATMLPAAGVAPTRLVCVDLEAEGRLAWSIGSDEYAAFPGGRFSGAPLVIDGKVYIAVRWGAPQVEVGLACFSAETGELQWHRRLCTASDASSLSVPRREDDVLAAGGGLVYQLPTGGVLAASDLETGELRWAVTYASSIGQSGSGHSDETESALVYHGGRVFAKPRDSKQVMSLHAGDGRIVWSLEPSGRVRDLLGVTDGRLIASGDQLWGFESATGRAWRFGFDDPEGYGTGLGAVAAGRIYWPTHDELFVVAAGTGELVERVAFRPGAEFDGGNLAVGDDQLIIAGPTRISAIGPLP